MIYLLSLSTWSFTSDCFFRVSSLVFRKDSDISKTPYPTENRCLIPARSTSYGEEWGTRIPRVGETGIHIGLDFQQVKQWTKELCQKDSDGDGLTNGQELGDPECVWHPGQFPQRTNNITHPGICDPWGSPKCTAKNDWVSCTAGEFVCNATKAPEVKKFTLRFPPTRVPPTQTNYYCIGFDVSNYIDISQDYHLIATMPEINNTNVMHHSILYGCNDDVVLADHATPCYMSQQGCSELLAGGTLGLDGTCEYEEAGYLTGRSGNRKMVMQLRSVVARGAAMSIMD